MGRVFGIQGLVSEMEGFLRGLEQAGWQQICEQYDVWELRVLRSKRSTCLQKDKFLMFLKIFMVQIPKEFLER